MLDKNWKAVGKDCKTVGQAMKVLRGNTEFTQCELAEKLGCHPNTVSKGETDTRPVSTELLIQLWHQTKREGKDCFNLNNLVVLMELKQAELQSEDKGNASPNRYINGNAPEYPFVDWLLRNEAVTDIVAQVCDTTIKEAFKYLAENKDLAIRIRDGDATEKELEIFKAQVARRANKTDIDPEQLKKLARRLSFVVAGSAVFLPYIEASRLNEINLNEKLYYTQERLGSVRGVAQEKTQKIRLWLNEFPWN